MCGPSLGLQGTSGQPDPAPGARVTQGRTQRWRTCAQSPLQAEPQRDTSFQQVLQPNGGPSLPFESWRLLTSTLHIKVSDCASAHLTAALCVRTCPQPGEECGGSLLPIKQFFVVRTRCGLGVGRLLALLPMSSSTNMHQASALGKASSYSTVKEDTEARGFLLQR